MAFEIVVLDGDGIGPEVVDAAVLAGATAAARMGATVDFVGHPVGLKACEVLGRTVPNETHQAVAKAGAALLGPVSTHLYDIFDPASANPSAYFRRSFDLYANVRPARSRASIPAPVLGMDLVIVRENTEGFYADRNLIDGNGELRPDENTVLSVRVVTRKACLRIARFGFQLARRRAGKKRVSMIHKANVLRRGDGLFFDCCRETAKEYPDVAVDDLHVDAAAMHLITRPHHFDVIITTNMFGDILSDEAAALVGGLGLAPGLNVGTDVAIAQAVHGSAPDIAGRRLGPITASRPGRARACRCARHRPRSPALQRISSTSTPGDALARPVGGRQGDEMRRLIDERTGTGTLFSVQIRSVPVVGDFVRALSGW